MRSLFSSIKKERLVAVFDIGSGSVGGAIVKVPEASQINKKRPEIIAETRFDIKSKNDFKIDFESFTKDMLNALGKTARSLFDLKVGAPEEIFCMLASPWYDSEIKTIKESNLKKITINNNLINRLTKKETEVINKEYNYRFPLVKDRRLVIEQYVSSFVLDGVLTSSPFNKKARNIEMNLVVSVSPKVLIEQIKEVIKKSFSTERIDFMSFASASYLAIRDNFEINKDTYFLIDIAGQTTDLVAVEKGFIKAFRSFPFGSNNLYRYLANKFNLDWREARNLFKLYLGGNLSLAMHKKTYNEVTFLEQTWSRKLDQEIDKIKEEGIKTSKNFFLTADRDVKELFTGIIYWAEQDETLLNQNKGVSIVALDGPLFLHNYYDKKCRFDPFLAIATLALTKEKIKTYD